MTANYTNYTNCIAAEKMLTTENADDTEHCGGKEACPRIARIARITLRPLRRQGYGGQG